MEQNSGTGTSTNGDDRRPVTGEPRTFLGARRRADTEINVLPAELKHLHRRHPASFRDPSGRITMSDDGKLCRIIEKNYLPAYSHLMNSGLYERLSDRALLIPHTQTRLGSNDAVIEPEIVPLITYPYEWTLREMRDAALTTLDIMRESIEYGMILKDASAFNIQWYKRSPILIDTLSFDFYEEGKPWGAFVQFLRHFIYPMILMKSGIPYPSWQNIDGVQPELARKLAPWKDRLSLINGPLLAVGMNQAKQDNNQSNGKITVRANKKQIQRVITGLAEAVNRMKYSKTSAWSEYGSCSYTATAYLDKKRKLFELLPVILEHSKATTAVDLGANTGEYTYMLKSFGIDTVALEQDPVSADMISPLSLVVDLCNPTPGIGWNNRERESLLNRLGEYNRHGLILALAVIHHLCIKNNVPLDMVIRTIAGLGKHLVIEFVPPDDPRAIMLANGRVYPRYDRDLFIECLSRVATIKSSVKITDSRREIFYAVTK